MHHNIDYSHLQGQEKIDKAVEDVREYMNDQQWEATKAMLKNPDYSYEFFSGCMENLVGISGYPVQALWEAAGREVPTIH